MDPIGESTRGRETTKGLPGVFYLIPWAFVALTALKLKYRLLSTEGGGFDHLAETIGVRNGESLAATQRLLLFREDMVALIIGGTAFLGLLRLLPSRMRASFAWITCTTICLVLYAQLKSWWEVGTFISARLMAAGLFGSGQDFVGEYAASATIGRFVTLLVFLAGVCALLAVLERWRKGAQLAGRFRWSRWPIAAGAAAIVVAALLVRVPPTPFARAASTAALSAFAGRDEFVHATPDLSHVTPTELVRRYARLANAPVPNHPSAQFGRARGYDVIFIMIESLPEVCYALAVTEGAMPNVEALERHAFVPAAHYSTYPYSRRAYSSIFSSWYPLNGIRGAFERYALVSRDLRTPGVVHSARLAGYETVAFVPERPVTIEEDELRYAGLGFAEHEVPPSAFERPEGQELTGLRDWVRKRDRQSFDDLKKRVARSIDRDQRFLYSFNPQLTHGPWPGISASSSREETCRAGIPLFRELDGMFGELRSVLQEKRRLDKTLIVVLGDHGLRTRREYPPFNAGTLDDVTFHVPLVLYAPGVVESTVRIPWMTSHIDLAPSVLDLLGIEEDRELELGSPMWEPAVADRTTFFFARSYLGADGYQRSNQAVMVRYLYGGVLRSPWNGTLRFRATDEVGASDGKVLHPVDDLTMMAAIQTELARTMLPTVGQLSRAAPVKRVSAGEPHVVKRDTASRTSRSPKE